MDLRRGFTGRDGALQLLQRFIAFTSQMQGYGTGQKSRSR
jgi:hypothetical protein